MNMRSEGEEESKWLISTVLSQATQWKSENIQFSNDRVGAQHPPCSLPSQDQVVQFVPMGKCQ